MNTGTQLTIFDWLTELNEYPDINDVTEAEAVKIVGEQIGVVFVYNQKYEYWCGKRGKLKLTMEYDHFVPGVNNQDLFLGTGYSYGTSGGGSPCSGIEEAISWFRRKMDVCK